MKHLRKAQKHFYKACKRLAKATDCLEHHDKIYRLFAAAQGLVENIASADAAGGITPPTGVPSGEGFPYPPLTDPTSELLS